MLKTHFDVVERSLIATGNIVAGAGHPLHKGTPREAFIRDFLALHLAENVGIGTGEVIDSNSMPNEPRNLDIVLYKKRFPKLSFGGGVSAFLSESVFATIEVKSTLDKEKLRPAIKAARNLKALTRHLRPILGLGYPPAIVTYVVAYEGPAQMNTVYEWISAIHEEENIALANMPPAIEERVKIPSPSIDVVVVLGNGFLYFDNSPLGVLTQDKRDADQAIKWIWVNQADGNLLFLFLHLTQTTSSLSITDMDSLPYLKNVGGIVSWGPVTPAPPA